jgi:hypothetical protein
MLHAHGSAAALGVVRIAVFGGWLASVLRDPMTDLALLPATAYAPVGVLGLLPDAAWRLLLSVPALAALKAALLTLLAALVAGLRPFSPLAFLACALLVLHQGLLRSIGDATHSELGLLVVAAVLAPFPAADALTIRGRRDVRAAPAGAAVYRAPLLAGAAILCLTYTFAGTRRLAAGGLQGFLDGSVVRIVAMRGLEAGPPGTGLGAWVLQEAWLAAALQVAFPAVTALELVSLACLGCPRFRRLWIAAQVSVHLAAAPLMQHPAWARVALVLLLLTNLPARIARWVAGPEPAAPGPPG